MTPRNSDAEEQATPGEFACDTTGNIAWLPFATMPFRVALYVGLPAYIAWRVWLWLFHPGAFVIGAVVALAGAQRAMADGQRMGRYVRELRSGLIALTESGIRLPVGGEEWEELAWDDIQSLSVGTFGGVLHPPRMRLTTSDRTVDIPRCVEEHEELLVQIRRHAGLTRADRSWFGVIWRAG